ncbi:MAG: hypothetical protein N4A33_03335 [Bacteriovoracaceae bacterium]|nr:hypothetical protein [Bacteriovoracaceae bacterium]
MRVLERESIQLFLGAFGLLFILSMNAHAAIHCKTAFGEKSFSIEKQSIAFHKQAKGRTISSIMDVRTKKTYLGFKKVLYINGNKHLISIANQRRFDDASDYMSVTNQKGHKMTYPLTCTRD